MRTASLDRASVIAERWSGQATDRRDLVCVNAAATPFDILMKRVTDASIHAAKAKRTGQR